MAQNKNDSSTSTVYLNGEQAKNELAELELKAKQLRKSIKEAAEIGDLAGIKKYQKELKSVTGNMTVLKKESFDAKKVLDNLSGSSLRDLYSAQKKIDSLLKNGSVTRRSKEWYELIEAQKKVKKEIANVNAEMSIGETKTSKFANGFNKYFAAVTAVIAGITGLTLGLKKFIEMRNEVEDSAANLQSLTGLGDQDIAWLRQYAKELSTTTTEAGVRITASAKEIMDGFTTIGSKRPELLKNKEAMAAVTKEALTLAAAGKMDVATAFDVVTASMNQFNLGAAESGRIINVIAAGSLEGSAEADSLAGSLKNVGTVADGSNMTLEDTIALLEVLASKQLMGEEAGTKLRGAILRMKDAGVGYVSGAFNMRDAIIEVNKQLDKKTSAAEKDALMQKIFGAENITVGQILVKNVEAYDKLKVAVTGTNTAYKQAEIQTDTVSAKMAQAKNRFSEAGMELVKNFNPAILKVTNFSANFLKILVQLPKWLNQNKGLLLTLTITMIAYTIAVERARIASLANLAIEKTKIIWTKASTAATLLQIAVTGYLTGSIRAANLATKAFFTTLGLNPFVAIALIIAAATIAIYKWVSANNQASESHKIFHDRLKKQKELTDEYSKTVLQEKSSLEGLVGAIMLVNNNNDLRLSMIKQMKEKYPEFLSYLSAEKITNEMLKGALMEVNEQYSIRIRNAALIGKSESFEDAAVKAEQRRIEIAEEINRLSKQNSDASAKRISELNDEDRQLQRNIKAYKQKSTTYRTEANLNDAEIKKMNSIEYAQSQLEVWFKAAEDFEKKFKEARESGLVDQANYYQKQLAESNNYVKFYIAKRAELRKAEEQKSNTNSETVKPTGDDLTDQERDKAFKKAEETLEASGKRKQIIIDDMYQKLNMSEYLYEQMSLYNTIESLKSKEKLYKQYGKDTADIEKQISDVKLKQFEIDKKNAENYEKSLESLKKLDIASPTEDNAVIDTENYTLALRLKILEAFHNKGLRSEEEYQNELANLLKGNQDEINKYLKDVNLQHNEQRYKDGLIGEKQYLDNNRQIYAEYIDNKFAKEQQLAEDISQIANAAADLSATMQDAALTRVDNKYAKELDAARKAGKDTTALEEQVENEKKEVKKKYADVDFAITVAQIIASTASAVMNALKIPPPFGEILAGIVSATGLVQIGVANEQRQAIKNLWTGGFTEPGDKYEPRGIVHAGEFVANQEAVGNNTLRRLFNVVDYAQKTNTVARIDNDAIARALSIGQGYSGGGFVAPAGTGAGSDYNTMNMAAMMDVMRQTNAVNAALLAEIQRGIVSKTYIHGDGGIEKAQETYNKIIKNAKG